MSPCICSNIEVLAVLIGLGYALFDWFGKGFGLCGLSERLVVR